jgi:hypothetical protein
MRVKEDKEESKKLTSKESFLPGHKGGRCEEN